MTDRKKLSEMTLDELWHLFPIQLTAPNARWAEYYEEMRQRLTWLLSDFDPEIHHIGSTAIHGIWAKPIVDVLIEFSKTAEMSSAADILKQNGFVMMSRDETRIFLNLGYTEQGFAEKVYHIHLRIAGDRDEIHFRNYLNSHPDIAREYEKLKLGLWKQYEFNRDGYTEAKTEFIRKYTNEAKMISELFDRVTEKDTKDGYNALLELEALSERSSALYPYTRQFADMVQSEKYVVRVRGFRLFCKQARWDVDHILDENIERTLSILHDPKPTAVRMAISALHDVLLYKSELRGTVIGIVESIDYTQYKDSMQGLIYKDVQKLIAVENLLTNNGD